MKTHRFPILIIVLLIAALAMTGCGGVVVNSWPGISAQQDTVYLAYQGSILAINAENGQLNCQFPEKADPSKPFYAAPAVSENVIVAGNYGHTLHALGTTCANQNKVLDEKWSFNTGEQDPNKKPGNFSGSPAIAGDTVLAPATNNRLYALSLTDGSLKWYFESQNTLWATPVSDGSLVYLSALDHNLYALDINTGKPAWKKDLGSALASAPLLTDDGTLYVSTLEGNVVALEASDGAVVWEQAVGGRLWSTPVLHEDALYVGNDAGNVTALAVEDGSVTWQQSAGSPIIASGLIMNENVAFATEGGTLVGWNLDGTKQTLNQTIGGKLYTTPVIAGEKAVVALMEGDKLLQALTLDGGLNWTFVQPK